VWLNGWEQGFTDPEQVGVALSEAIAHGDWRLYFLQRDRVRQLTLADINRVATAWLRATTAPSASTSPPQRPSAPRKASAWTWPPWCKDYRGDASRRAGRSLRPHAGHAGRAHAALRVGGLKVALLPKGTRGRVVHARLALRYGDEKSLFGQETVAGFAAGLLDKGGAGLTRQQIADQLDKLQAEVGFGSSGQVLSVNINTRRQHLPAVIALVGRLLREPAFPAEPLEEVRRQWLTGIERQRKEPDA
jgi:zinc protease